MPLTAKQRLFITEYCVDKNATQAAIRAGYSRETAGSIGGENLQKPEIADAIAQELAQQEKVIRVDAARVLAEYARLAFADHARAYDEAGNLLPITEWPDDLRRCVSSFDVDTRVGDDGQPVMRLTKVRFWPKGQALEALGKHLQLFIDKVELGAEGGPVTITINRKVQP